MVLRMDTVKQALMLFVHSKLTVCPDHLFAFPSLGETVTVVTDEFISDSATTMEAIGSLAATETRYAMDDLTELLKIAYHEGKREEQQGRLLRVVSLLQAVAIASNCQLTLH